MIRHTLLLAALLAGLTSIASAQEQTDDKKKQRPERERTELIKKFDKNGDGKLDEAERKAAREHAGKQRAKRRENGDTPPARGKRGGETPPNKGKGRRRGQRRGGADRAAMMKQFDKNGDGKLDDTERAALRKHVTEQRAKRRENGGTPPQRGKRRDGTLPEKGPKKKGGGSASETA